MCEVGTATFKWFQFTDELELVFQARSAASTVLGGYQQQDVETNLGLGIWV